MVINCEVVHAVDFYKGFRIYLKQERGRSDKTIAAYLGDIDRFTRWLEPHLQPPYRLVRNQDQPHPLVPQ